jgi:hypothetical protein
LISSPSQGKCPCSLGPLASDQDQTTTAPRASQRGQKGQAPRVTEKEADRKLDNRYGFSDKKRRRSLKKLNTPVPHRPSSPQIFINISDPRTRSAFGGMEDTRHPHPFLPSPSLKNHQQMRSTCRRSQGQKGMKEHPSPSLPPASTPPPPTTKGPERSTSCSSSFVEAGPAIAEPPSSLLSASPSLPFLQELASSCSFFQLRRARRSVSRRGAFPWRSSALTGAPRTPRSAPLPRPVPCGRCLSWSSISPAIGRGPPRPRPSHASLLFIVQGALLLLPVRGGHRPRHHRRLPQEAAPPPLDRLHRQLKLLFRASATSCTRSGLTPRASARGGFATALSRCPTPPRTFSLRTTIMAPPSPRSCW